jgi:branched-chain amino acid transport system substrate-binding protein
MSTWKSLCIAVLCAVFALALGACGSVGDDEPDDAASENGPERIKVGLVIPQSGVYAPLGEDMKAAWDLWLDQNGGKIGGLEVETVVVDEGEGPDTGVPAIQKVLQQDQVDVVVGVVNSATALGAVEIVDGAKKVMVVANAGAGPVTGSSKYIWRTSFTNEQVAYAIGKHMASTPGGKIVGQAMTPFGTTQDFQPFLSKVRSSGAGAVYAFYAGAEAVSFVKQYKEFGISKSAPLYGSGFLTEGGVLQAQGAAARGVQTSLHYATTLDNEANTAFSEAYQGAAGRPPTVYAVQMWDAASVLDKAVQEAGAVDGDALADALGGLGEITDSPRGPWSFEQQSPLQEMYLREVEPQDGAETNVVLDSLGEIAPAP